MSSLFRSTFLRGVDLNEAAPDGLVVTIDRIISVPRRPKFLGDRALDPAIKFREIRQPWRLNAIADQMLERLIGADAKTWPGRVIRIVAVEVEIREQDGNIFVWVVQPADQLPSSRPALPPDVDIDDLIIRRRSGGSPVEDPNAKLGIEEAVELVVVLQAHGQNWDSFLRFLRIEAPELYEGCIGNMPPDCPAIASEWARKFAAMFPMGGAVSSSRNEIRDSWVAPMPPTGEIRGAFAITTASSVGAASVEIVDKPAKRPPTPPGLHIDEEDIPF